MCLCGARELFKRNHDILMSLLPFLLQLVITITGSIDCWSSLELSVAQWSSGQSAVSDHRWEQMSHSTSGCCWTLSPVNQYKYFYWDPENKIFLNCYHNSQINSSSTCVLTPVSNVVWHENDVFGGQKITFVCRVSTVCAGKCPCLNRGRHEIRVAGGCLICTAVVAPLGAV